MRIGYFMETLARPSETFVYDLCKGLQDRHTDTALFLGIQSEPVSSGFRNIIYTGHAAFDPKRLKMLYNFSQLLRRGNQNVHAYKKRFAFQKLSRLSKEQLPEVAYIDFLTSGVQLMDFLTDREIPFIVHAHGFDITFKLQDYAFRDDLPKLFDQAAYFVVASNHIRRLMILQGCPPEKIRVIRYGLNVDAIQPLPPEARTPHPSILFFGRLTMKKHPIALIHAFRMVLRVHPEARLTMIGDGPLRSQCEQTIRQFGLQGQVDMTGAMSREEAFKLMGAHWIYAQHSVTSLFGDQEGFAISPAEAAAHEIPVVATWHNGIPEHVQHGETGYLVAEFNYEAMAERIIELIEKPELRQQMGKAGRKRVRELCVPDLRIETIYQLLEAAFRK